MPFMLVMAPVIEAATAEALVATAAGELATAATAAELGTAATAAELGTAAAADLAGGIGAAGTTAAEMAQLGISGVPQGIASQVAPAMEAASAVGGQGAGGAGVQSAMQGAMQQAPLELSAQTQAPAGLGQIATPPAPAGEVTRGIAQVTPQPSPYTSFDSFGNPAPAGSPAATMADPTGLAQMQLEANAAQAAPSALEAGWQKFSNFVEKNPKTSMALGYLGAQSMGLFDPKSAQMPNTKYSGPLDKYRLSENFQAGPNEPNRDPYQPTYPSYAGGGIMEANDYPQSQLPNPGGYSTGWQSPIPREPFAGAADTGVNSQTGEMQQMASGGVARYAKGNLTETLDMYRKMMESKSSSGASAPHGGDAGIYYDMDPDTRYQDALTAAQIRQAKLNKRSNMQVPATKRPTPMGTLNLRAPGAKEGQSQSSLDSENAARGGIMQAYAGGGMSTLGGYAAGGNPRLLKGPGDGMSDNIPATIAGKQPARLADGEFVITADVVSHLGNGSTEAGAKKLHQMMTNVRKARTGNPKQGKQINPNRFMPK